MVTTTFKPAAEASFTGFAGEDTRYHMRPQPYRNYDKASGFLFGVAFDIATAACGFAQNFVELFIERTDAAEACCSAHVHLPYRRRRTSLLRI